MKKSTIELLRHILTARIDNSRDISEYLAWCDARDIIEYALAENIKVLKLYDAYNTKNEEAII